MFGRVWLRTSTPTKNLMTTDDNMRRRDLLEKTTDTDFLREMIGFIAQRLMARRMSGRNIIYVARARGLGRKRPFGPLLGKCVPHTAASESMGWPLQISA